MRLIPGLVLLLAAAAGCDPGTNPLGNPAAGPDNTAINQRDSGADTKTPFDQSNSAADTELVARLRAEVLKIDGLSVNGQNIKIITDNLKVVLRGPVDSAAERDSILKVARQIAGENNVTDQLEIGDR